MIRSLVKQAAAGAIHGSGADRLIAALGGRRGAPLVLCYHRVVEDVRRHPWCAPAMMVSLATLESQLDWVGRQYDFVDLDTLGRIEKGELSLRRPAAAVTFDDGYEDVVRLALPRLDRKGIPAAIFVVTDRIGVDRLHRHDELYWLMQRWSEERSGAELARHLESLGVSHELTRGLALEPPAVVETKERLLRRLPRRRIERLIAALRSIGEPPREVRDDLKTADWPALRAIHARGTLIGSHTRSHGILPHEEPAGLAAELRESKQALESGLGAEVAHLSYPDGRFSPSTLAAAAAAGYRYAYTTCEHRSADHPHLTVPRRTFWEGSTAGPGGSFSPSIAACAVNGLFDRFATPCRGHRGLRVRPFAALASRPLAAADTP